MHLAPFESVQGLRLAARVQDFGDDQLSHHRLGQHVLGQRRGRFFGSVAWDRASLCGPWASQESQGCACSLGPAADVSIASFLWLSRWRENDPGARVTLEGRRDKRHGAR